ncbi:hypothetical protein NDU88_001434 [Pleurodeles waltl]|uniref:Uncharacterized protein n=1 Tax=Pleurodeles waltl TaxID=8319 RepID=A0AAV7R802_PLEWA|nr:hypothetical protein NDU88_001434 [Pleurodeles waltl]
MACSQPRLVLALPQVLRGSESGIPSGSEGGTRKLLCGTTTGLNIGGREERGAQRRSGEQQRWRTELRQLPEARRRRGVRRRNGHLSVPGGITRTYQPRFRRSVATAGAFWEPKKERVGGREEKGTRTKSEWKDGRRREQEPRGSGRTEKEGKKKTGKLFTESIRDRENHNSEK